MNFARLVRRKIFTHQWRGEFVSNIKRNNNKKHWLQCVCALSRVAVLSKPQVTHMRRCAHKRARAHAHLNNLPQAAFPIIIHVFYAQVHPPFLLERTMLSNSVWLSEKLHCHLHARPVHQKRIEQVTEAYNCSFNSFNYMHLSIATQTPLNFPPSRFNYARIAIYSQKMSTWVKFIQTTDLFSWMLWF